MRRVVKFIIPPDLDQQALVSYMRKNHIEFVVIESRYIPQLRPLLMLTLKVSTLARDFKTAMRNDFFWTKGVLYSLNIYVK